MLEACLLPNPGPGPWHGEEIPICPQAHMAGLCSHLELFFPLNTSISSALEGDITVGAEGA